MLSMRGISIAIIAAALSSGSAGAADLTTAQAIQAFRKDPQTIGIYLTAVWDGLSAANAVLTSQGKPPLYCAPEKLAMTPHQTVDILRRYVEQHPFAGKVSIVVITLQAYMDAFPCRP